MTTEDAATRMNTIESGNWCRVQAVTAVRQKTLLSPRMSEYRSLVGGKRLVLLHSDYDSLAWDLGAMSGSG